jgi:hypothetical protein
MASREAIGIRQQNALAEIRAVLEKYDTEAGERLTRAADGDAVPSSFRQPNLFGTYLAESVATLARLVDRQLTPRRRGRPRKDAS